MRILIICLISVISISAFSQGIAKPNFNRWSIDGRIGVNNPVKNFTPGYNTPLYNIGTAGIGVRYMFNAYFGLGLNATFNRFQDNNESPEFATNHGRFELNGVVNLGNSLRFYEWSNRIGLLAHFGAGFGRMKAEGFPLNFLPLEKENTDRVGTFTFGLTPQIKLTPKLALNFDASVVFQARTNNTFDFMSPAVEGGGFNSRFFEGTIGLSYYIGKKESHADWTPTKSVSKDQLDAVAEENAKMRKGMEDDDKDGVPNYLDQELDTPENTPVNLKGVTDLTKLDSDMDGIADSFDACPKEKGPFSTNGCPDSDKDGVADKDDKCPDEPGVMSEGGCKPVVKSFGAGGNSPTVYFKTSSFALSSAAKAKLDAAASTLKANPEQNVVLSGHADATGTESLNVSLSKNRAEEAKRYLMQKGISASRISASGFSSTQPAQSNDTAEGRSMNRRVEIQLN